MTAESRLSTFVATDGDNVQQGDQNTPDVPGAAETPDTPTLLVSRNSAKPWRRARRM